VRAERVAVGRLRAGDYVLTSLPTVGSTSSAELVITQVLVNLHAATPVTAEVLTLHTVGGSAISLTPTHAIEIDGVLRPASDARQGSTLTDAHGKSVRVAHITSRAPVGVVNPLTASGTLLASDAGAPVLASTHAIWATDPALMLARAAAAVGPRPLALSASLAQRWPDATQAYADAWLEPMLEGAAALLVHSWPAAAPAQGGAAAPSVSTLWAWLVVQVLATLADICFVTGLLAFELARHQALLVMCLAVAATASACVVRRQRLASHVSRRQRRSAVLWAGRRRFAGTAAAVTAAAVAARCSIAAH